ncbi:hypothetical protein ACQHGV_13620 [Sphingomonas pseudosanguinis]|uniref:hypothetical protein n=1 Tax=Sphingomonas pseudosanguinis TaxID=413712 RepID=UPI003F839F3E
MTVTHSEPEARTVTIMLTRDSVCLADDVDAPHEHALDVEARTDFHAIARSIAARNYLPMPSDAWGWVIEAGDVAIAIRPGLFAGRTTMILRGGAESVIASDMASLHAIYVRPASPWRSFAPPPRRIDPIVFYVLLGAILVMLSGVWFSRR